MRTGARSSGPGSGLRLQPRMGYNFQTMDDLSLLWIPAGTFAILAAVILMFLIF